MLVQCFYSCCFFLINLRSFLYIHRGLLAFLPTFLVTKDRFVFNRIILTWHNPHLNIPDVTLNVSKCGSHPGKRPVGTLCIWITSPPPICSSSLCHFFLCQNWLVIACTMRNLVWTLARLSMYTSRQAWIVQRWSCISHKYMVAIFLTLISHTSLLTWVMILSTCL